MIHQEAADEIILISETLLPPHRRKRGGAAHFLLHQHKPQLLTLGADHRRPLAAANSTDLTALARLGDVYAKHSRIGDKRDIRPKMSSEVAAEPDFIGPIDGVTTGLPEHRQQLIFIKIEFRRPTSYVRPDTIVREPAAIAKPKVLCATVKVGNHIVYLERPSGIGHPIANF